ncbi:MAG: glycoside hydrolase family 127 protein [Anaerolineae bacterium]|nr:glycoside hydrolase family 127 protein [Anaerolineae bacterium]
MTERFRQFKLGDVALEQGQFRQRFDLNRRYVMSLTTEHLLQNFYLEAGLWAPRDDPGDIHWGWESPTCQLRGHFLGHWLSAAARIYATTGDAEVKGKADRVVSELARCQIENGGAWVGSIPTTYLDWVARGKPVWAPHYTLHKTLMGLVDMATYAGNARALEILERWAEWFYRWTGEFTRREMDDILDVETGGMLEAWADLYGLTGKEQHRELMERYDRPRLFDRLLAGEDALTNMHANTTIPEAQGAARAWEVTGKQRWRDIAEAYWDWAVTRRGTFCTGGQTNGEIWTPPFELASRLGEKTQEHCTVYNMMRLATYLLRWTGDVSYADYWERNLYNGILAQQNPNTGLIAYFLPLRPGSRKIWGTPTRDFWCCHGSLVQAHTMYADHVFFEDDAGLVLVQYIPSMLKWEREDALVTVSLKADTQLGSAHRPKSWAYRLSVTSEQPRSFTLKIRLPWWLRGEARILVNGEAQPIASEPSTFVSLTRTWTHDHVAIVLPKALTTCPLPDEPSAIAFMDGPVVLAGLVDGARTLCGDWHDPASLLKPENEREWTVWRSGYRTVGQPQDFRLVPLYQIVDEPYTVYFPVYGAGEQIGLDAV